MIILDTNVVSELMARHADEQVLGWLRKRPARELFTTVVTEAEIRAGVELLPRGKRRDALDARADAVFTELADRILAFDRRAAAAFGVVVATRRRAGRPIDDLDAQIAAIAKSWDASVATRNVADFAGCGVDIVNPWTER